VNITRRNFVRNSALSSLAMGLLPTYSGAMLRSVADKSPNEYLFSGIQMGTHSLLNAGAHGLVASRDYDELQTKNIEAFGRAVRDFKNRI